MIGWGGRDYPNFFNTGGTYDPAADTWTATITAAAPSARDLHTAVWTGSTMIVWGGRNIGTGDVFNTGGIYDPAADTWTATSTAGTPIGRYYHTAVWTGSKMIVWGGRNGAGDVFNTGGIYDPTTDIWTATSTAGAPTARQGHTVVWTGSKMIVWGGRNGAGDVFNIGGIYDPATDTWTATSTTGTPTGRFSHSAVWTGSKMIVWGGWDGADISTGGIYDLVMNTWTATSAAGAPSGPRVPHGGVDWLEDDRLGWDSRYRLQ